MTECSDPRCRVCHRHIDDTERDGVWVVLGHVGTLADLTLLVVFGATVLLALDKAWHWIA